MANLILNGPPGAGKGTQSARLRERLGIPIVATGDILRDEVRRKSKLGMKAQQYMDKGTLIPDDLMIGVVEERLKRADCARGFILDGFPRTVPQAEALDRMLLQLGRSITRVISLNVSGEQLVKRLGGRRTCRDCGAMWHLASLAPSKEGICDKCQGPLYQRDDDHEEVVHERFEIYDRLTAPLLDYYRAQGLLVEIDGSGNRDEVSARIQRHLESRNV